MKSCRASSWARWTWVAAVVAMLAPGAAWAQWDATKPADGQAPVSVEIRNNWLAIQRTLGGQNLVGDPEVNVWPHGDTTAPAYYTLAGAGASIARAGTGLADTARKVGPYSAKVTAGAGATATLTQNLLGTALYDDSFDGRWVSCGAWIRSSSASSSRLRINDGAGTTTSVFNSGVGAFEWLTATRTIDATATQLVAGLEVAQGTTGYLSGLTCVIGQTPPANYLPGVSTIRAHRCFLSGVQTTGTRKVGTGCDFYWPRPWIVLATSVRFTTAVPSGSAFLVDVNHFDGSVHQSMYSTRPQVASGTAVGSPAAPDGTYRYRCFAALTGTSQTDRLLTIDVDSPLPATPGTDATVEVWFRTYDRPLEVYLGVADVG